ncbi:hypothetical protein FRC18_007553 [Serendipita sp. 400]|nr:hypothetical protein FRC18_007553 [Serendipita sp. 400]
MSDTLVQTADISTITSATRSTLHFNSNQVPNDTTLKYLSSEIRNRQMELNQLLSKKAICEEEIKVHAEAVKSGDSTLIVAQGGVEFHSNIEQYPTVRYVTAERDAETLHREGNSPGGLCSTGGTKGTGDGARKTNRTSRSAHGDSQY